MDRLMLVLDLLFVALIGGAIVSLFLLPRCLAWVVTTVRAWQPMFFGSAERRFSVPA